MRLRRHAGLGLVALGLALLSPSARPGARAPEPPGFDSATLIVQYNASEDEAELILAVESSEPLRRVRLRGPQGLVHRLDAPSPLGIEDLGFETPPMSLPQLTLAMPAGLYTLRAVTLDGQPLRQRLKLSYELPPTPLLFSPLSIDSPHLVDELVFQWMPLAEGEMEMAIEKKVRLDDDDDDDDDPDDEDREVIRIKIPKKQSQMVLPKTTLEPGCDYQADLVSIHPNGNRCFIEQEFHTADD